MLASKRSLSSLQSIKYVILPPTYNNGCAVSTSITATVVGNTRHHTFLWEQISGSSTGVVYTTPLNQLTVTYNNLIPPGINDDKQFRFWVDKGTGRQKHYDVWVRSSPLDYIYPSISQQSNTNNTKSEISASWDKIWLNYGTTLSPTTNPQTGYFIEWNYPINHDSSRFVCYIIQQFNKSTGTWSNIAETINYWYLNPTNDTQYRVVAKYTLNNLTYDYGNSAPYCYIYSPIVWYNAYNTLNTTDTVNTIRKAYHVTDKVFQTRNFNVNTNNATSNYINYSIKNYLVNQDTLSGPLNLNTNLSNATSNYINYSIKNYLVTGDIVSGPSNLNVNKNNAVTAYVNYSNINIG